MIKLDIGTLVFFYTLFSAVLILLFWVFAGYKNSAVRKARDTDYMWRCSVCSHSYVDSKHDEMSVCPLCGSYNKKDAIEKEAGK